MLRHRETVFEHSTSRLNSRDRNALHRFPIRAELFGILGGVRGIHGEAHLAQRLLDRNGWTLLLSPPRGCNWFFRMWPIQKTDFCPSGESP